MGGFFLFPIMRNAAMESPTQESTVTKEEIIRAVQKYAAKLGRTPRSAEFHKHARLSPRMVLRHFGTFTRLLAASGVERRGPGVPIGLEELFLDWASVARKLGKVPAKT